MTPCSASFGFVFLSPMELQSTLVFHWFIQMPGVEKLFYCSWLPSFLAMKCNPTVCSPREPLAKGFLGYLISLKDHPDVGCSEGSREEAEGCSPSRSAVPQDQSRANRAGPVTVARVSHSSVIARQAHSDKARPRAPVSRARSRSAKEQTGHGHTYNIAQPKLKCNSWVSGWENKRSCCQRVWSKVL